VADHLVSAGPRAVTKRGRDRHDCLADRSTSTLAYASNRGNASQ